MRLTYSLRQLLRPAGLPWLCVVMAGAVMLQAQTSSLSITTTSPLPNATVGASYSQSLTESGGTAPFTWAVSTGFPDGLSLNASSGLISGTATTAGSYSFRVQVSDATGLNAVASFALTVVPAPLQIVTVSPLFNGQVGSAYSQPFSASGGTAPYTWAIASGDTGGLTLNATSGVLSGTPQTAGTYNFVVKVSDSLNVTVSQNFALTIAAPTLIITSGTSLPSGTVGVAYDQKLSVAVSGGTGPYTWSLASGSVPGLTFLPATIELSGTPTSAGTFSLTLKATDSIGDSATRALPVTIAPASLTIVTARQLSASSLNVAFSQTLIAAGGTPPYTWSANGLPTGLTLNSSTGVLSGTPTSAGSFTPVITVTDSSLNTYRDNFSLTVSLPAVPAVTISGLSATSGAAQQYPIQVSIASVYSAAIRGQLILSFQPNSGPGDSTIQFSIGGQTANFTIPAGSTIATFLDNSGLSISQLQVQTGTAAGSIVLSLSNLLAAGVDVTPTPAPSVSTQISAAAPVISKVQVIRNADTTTGCKASQICIEVTGYSTAREVTQGTFTFSAVAGQTLQSSAGSITVDVSSAFSTWFTSSTMGGQFILVQSFTVTGDPTQVLSNAVTLTNRTGSTTVTVNQ